MAARRTSGSSFARACGALGLALALMLPGAASANIFVADRREYRPADQPLLRSVGLLVNGRRQVGTAFLVGECHVMTAFHSAFFRDAQAVAGNEFAGEPRTGRALSFHIGPDPVKPGRFRSRSVARVVDFGNYHPLAPRGMTGDWAILELEDCLGREYGALPHLRPSVGEHLPRGPLMTISFPYAGWNRAGVAVEEGCRAREAGPVTGLVAVDCAFEAGMSGGPVLERQPDGQWRVVGIMQLRVSPVDGVLPAFVHRHRNQMVHAVAFFRSLERVLAGAPVREAVADADAERRLAFERAGVELVLEAQRVRREDAAAGRTNADRARDGDDDAADTSIASWRGDLDADAVDELILRLCRGEAERRQRCSIHVLTQDRSGRPRLAGTLADAAGPVRLGFAQVNGWRPLIVGEGGGRRGLVFDGRRGRGPRGAPVPARDDSEEIMKVETLVGPLREPSGTAAPR
jgi:hypothetical protein